MSTISKKLSRRRFMRGALAGGATYALSMPLLECLMNAKGTAYANGDPLPIYYGTYFWALGSRYSVYQGDPTLNVLVPEDRWTPQILPNNQLHLDKLLTALGPFASKLNVLSGYEAYNWNDGFKEHHSSQLHAVLSGGSQSIAHSGKAPFHMEPEKPSLDAVILDHARRAEGRAFPLGAIHAGVHSTTFVGYKHSPWVSVSWNGPGSMNPPLFDPGAVYQQVASAVGAVVNQASASHAQNGAIIDQAWKDMSRFRQEAGSEDQLRLEQYFSDLSDAQNFYKAPPAIPPACNAVAAPVPWNNSSEQIDRFASLITTAMQCDVTRVFTLAFTLPGSDHIFPDAAVVHIPGNPGPAAINVHGTGHWAWYGGLEPLKEAYLAQLRRAVDGYRALLARLDSVVLPNGQTMLDRSIILATSDNADGQHDVSRPHQIRNFPIIVAGGAGGRIRTGQHIHRSGGNAAEVGLTILKAAGLPITEFGWPSSAHTTTTVPGMLA